MRAKLTGYSHAIDAMIFLRTIILTVLAASCFLLGRYLLEAQTVVEWYRHTAYWTLALTFILFIYFLVKGWGGFFRNRLSSLRKCGDIKRQALWAALALLPGWLVLYHAADPGFKTVMDEHTIAATAKRMHEARKTEAPIRVMSINGFPHVLWAAVDKRPAFFPFLTSVVHDLSGFRPHNSVYLNRALAFIYLLLVYWVALRLSSPQGGVLAVWLASSIPLFGLAANGGGLEILNLLMILLLVPLGAGYLVQPSAARLGALCMAAILLAQTRYESVIFIIPVALTVLWRHLRDRDLQWQWPLFLCPPLLLPYLWQNRIFSSSEASWQLDDVAGATTPFGPAYFMPNLERAVEFFFSFSHQAGNSFLLSLLGGISLLALLVFALRRVGRFASVGALYQSTVFVGAGVLVLFIILLAYAWEFNNPIIQRLTLPLHLPLILAPVILFFRVLRSPLPGQITLVLTALFLIGFTLPTNSQGYLTHTYGGGHDYRLAADFLAEQPPGQRPLVISDNAPFFYLMGADCLATFLANSRGNQIDFFINQPNTAPVFYFVPMGWDPVAGKFKYSSKNALGESFILEPYWERSYSEMHRVNVFRVLGYRNAEWEGGPYESRRDYLINFGRNLP